MKRRGVIQVLACVAGALFGPRVLAQNKETEWLVLGSTKPQTLSLTLADDEHPYAYGVGDIRVEYGGQAIASHHRQGNLGGVE